jgi:hypothetical protein
MSSAFGGAFGAAFSAAFSGAGEQVILLRLDFPVSIDDHARPDHPTPLWNRFHYPETQVGLFVSKDGTVRQTTTFETQEYFRVDAHPAGGYEALYPPEAWEVQVLKNAGYTFTEVFAPPPIVPFRTRPYGTDTYGSDVYG